MNDWKRKRQKLTHWPRSSVLCVFYSSRYWGEPFPIIYDEANPDVAIPLTEADLPLTLPEVVLFCVFFVFSGPGSMERRKEKRNE